MSGTWSVDTAGLIVFFSQFDDIVDELESAARNFRAVPFEGESVLVAGGRREFATAWESFCEERTDVPRKLMWLLQQRSGQVSDAAAAVIAGDMDIAAATADFSGYALSEWGIASKADYRMEPAS